LELTARKIITTTPSQSEKILRNPLIAGGGIGATTGLIAPYFYGTISESLYQTEGLSDSFNYLLSTFHYSHKSVARLASQLES